MKDDNHFVFSRPKAIINSSASTCTTETIRLRQRHPDLFEIKDKTPGISSQFRTSCSVNNFNVHAFCLKACQEWKICAN